MQTDSIWWLKSNAVRRFVVHSQRTLRAACSLVLLALPLAVDADDLAETAVAMVKRSEGEVAVISGGVRQTVAVGTALRVGDELQTGPDGSVGFTFQDNSQLSLGPNSAFIIETFRFDKTTHGGEFRTRVRRGTLGVISGKLAKQSPDAVKVVTPSSILGVSGTEFLVEVPGEQP